MWLLLLPFRRLVSGLVGCAFKLVAWLVFLVVVLPLAVWTGAWPLLVGLVAGWVIIRRMFRRRGGWSPSPSSNVPVTTRAQLARRETS